MVKDGTSTLMNRTMGIYLGFFGDVVRLAGDVSLIIEILTG